MTSSAQDELYHKITLAGSCVVILLLCSIIIYHCYKQRQQKLSQTDTKMSLKYGQNNKMQQYAAQLNSFLPYLIEFFYIILSIIGIIRDTKINHQYNIYSCSFTIRMVGLLWVSGKGTLWIIFILRLYIAFQNSIFQYSVSKIIIPFIIYSVLATLAAATFGVMFSHGQYDEYGRCMWYFPLWALTLLSVSDIFISIVSLVLFITPLMKMTDNNQQLTKTTSKTNIKPTKSNSSNNIHGKNNNQHDKHDNHDNPNNESINHFRFLIKKMIILVSLTIFTSFLSLASVIFLNSENIYHAMVEMTIVYIDVLTNGICAILALGIHDNLFINLCYCFIYLCNINTTRTPINLHSIKHKHSHQWNHGYAHKKSSHLSILTSHTSTRTTTNTNTHTNTNTRTCTNTSSYNSKVHTPRSRSQRSPRTPKLDTIIQLNIDPTETLGMGIGIGMEPMVSSQAQFQRGIRTQSCSPSISPRAHDHSRNSTKNIGDLFDAVSNTEMRMQLQLSMEAIRTTSMASDPDPCDIVIVSAPSTMRETVHAGMTSAPTLTVEVVGDDDHDDHDEMQDNYKDKDENIIQVQVQDQLQGGVEDQDQDQDEVQDRDPDIRVENDLVETYL